MARCFAWHPRPSPGHHHQQYEPRQVPLVVMSWLEITPQYVRWTSGHESSGPHIVQHNQVGNVCLAILDIPGPIPRVILSIQSPDDPSLAHVLCWTDRSTFSCVALRATNMTHECLTTNAPTCWTLWNNMLMDVHKQTLRVWNPRWLAPNGVFKFDANDEAAGQYTCMTSHGDRVILGGTHMLRMDVFTDACTIRQTVACHKVDHPITTVTSEGQWIVVGDAVGIVGVYASHDLSVMCRVSTGSGPVVQCSVDFSGTLPSLWILSHDTFHILHLSASAARLVPVQDRIAEQTMNGAFDAAADPAKQSGLTRDPYRMWTLKETNGRIVVTRGSHVVSWCPRMRIVVPSTVNALGGGILCPIVSTVLSRATIDVF